jgi:hypothetical protein
MKLESKDERELKKNDVNMTKSKCLLKWLKDSKLLEEELLGERMHKQLLARSTPLLTTMARNLIITSLDLKLLWIKGKDLHGAEEMDLSTSGKLL